MTTRLTPGSFTHSRYTDVVLNNGEVMYVEEPSSWHKSWTDSVSFGENHPDWRSRLRLGMSATTSMDGVRTTYRYTPGRIEWTVIPFGPPHWGRTTRMVGNCLIDIDHPLGNPASIDSTRANAEALGKFNKRIREKITAFQGGVFLGELGQTLRTIRNPALGLRRSADDFLATARRIRKEGLGGATARNLRSLLDRTTSNLADAWLELQFGWKPLLHDIDDGSKALAVLNTGQSLSTGRVTASEEVSSNPAEFITNRSIGIQKWMITTVSSDHCLVVYRGAMRAEARNPALMKAELLGFDPSSFAPTVWELIPYSFLIDYFTNIGDIIEGWSQIATRLAWCNRTVRQTSRGRSESYSSLDYCRAMGVQNLEAVTCVPAKVVMEKTVVTRGEFNGIRNPDFIFRVPRVGSTRWLNIAALVASRQNDRNWSHGD